VVQADCSCAGTPEIVLGCALPDACNFDPNATIDDGSCIYAIGVDDSYSTSVSSPIGFNPVMNDDGCAGVVSLQFSGLCSVPALGTISVDPYTFVLTYTPNGTGTGVDCFCYEAEDIYVENYQLYQPVTAEICITVTGDAISGCTDMAACNYDPDAVTDDGTCDFGNSACADPCNPILGCTDPVAMNYNSSACVDDGSCAFDPNCPTLANFTASTNVACDGDVINLTASLSDPAFMNATLTIALSGSVAPPFNLVNTGGVYSGSFDAVNTECGPIIMKAILTATCDLDGSNIEVAVADVTVYPAGIEQFISISQDASGCSATAVVDPLCDGFVTASTGTTIQGIPGQVSAADFCFDYFSTSAPLCVSSPYCESIDIDCSTTVCEAEAGIMPTGIQIACSGDLVNVAASGAVPGTGNSLAYVMHDGTFTTIYGWSLSGIFVNDGTIPANIFPEPVISSVAGPTGANGYPDLADPCTDVSDFGTPIRFLTEIIVTAETICNETSGEYDVTFYITGGYPDFPNGNNAFYTIDGDFSGMAFSGTNYSFGPLPDGSTYLIQVLDDQKGCNFSYSGTPECIKTPVTLMNYTGEVLPAGNHLRWITASEVDNDFYTLEVSEDGGASFRYLTTVDGAGTTSAMSTYNYLHADATTGTSYYRLSQTDFDGTTEELGIVALDRKEGLLNILTVSPVPAIDNINIQLEASEDSQMTMNLTDLTGKVLSSTIVQLHKIHKA